MAAPNPQIPIEARQTVLDMIVANQSFTAYEITLEVRRRLGTSVEVPHPIVNGVVQTMFSGGEIMGYNRAPDATVNAANPPFRYSPAGTSSPAATSVTTPITPTSPTINRANLPEVLRFSDPIKAIIREYGLEARDFHIAAGTPDKAFDVVPNRAQNTFSIRSFGAGLSEAEVIARYSLLPLTRFDGRPISQAAFAYVDEFEITSFRNGVETVYRAALDAALVGTVTKQSETSTTRQNGIKIKIALRSLGDWHQFRVQDYRHLRVKPHFPGTGGNILAGILGLGRVNDLSSPQILAKGSGWRVTAFLDSHSVAIMDEVAYPIEDFLVNDCKFAHTGSWRQEPVEFDFPVGSLDVSPNRETLVFSDKTKAALKSAFERMIEESKSKVETQLAAAQNIWEAKQFYNRLLPLSSSGRLQAFLISSLQWRGVPLQNHWFDVSSTSGIAVRVSLRDRYTSSGIRTTGSYHVTPTEKSVVVFNDLSTQTGSPARVKQFFQDNPDVQAVYVFTFASDAVKDKFIRDTHFETVPVRSLSTLPKPASTVRVITKVPFDSAKHFEQRPDNALVAAYFDGNADFDALEKWARTIAFNKANWPDWKRLYKHIELRIWPIPTRSRWQKGEAELPPSPPIPGERELILLGSLVAHLAATDGRNTSSPRQNRGFTSVPGTVSPDGPTTKTLAYLLRRAERLLTFLRDRADLSATRRAWIAPLAAGMFQSQAGVILAARLNLADNEELAKRPDLIERLWNDVTLAPAVLANVYRWLLRREIEVRATPAHIRVLLSGTEGELALELLPSLLENGIVWPSDYTLEDVTRDLEALTSIEKVLSVFARFSQLNASNDWINTHLEQIGVVSQQNREVLEWATNWVRLQARQGRFTVVEELSPPLLVEFNEALVSSFPNGLTADLWKALVEDDQPLYQTLAPALNQLPLSTEAAHFLWTLSSSQRALWLGAVGESKFAGAFAGTIEQKAREADWTFAASLSPTLQKAFFDALVRIHPEGLTFSQWQQLGAVSLDSGLAQLPLNGEFWQFFGSLPVDERAIWLERVDIARAQKSFEQRSASEIAVLLDGNTQGLESLFDAWIEANLSRLGGNEEVVLKLATGDNSTWRELALAHLRSRSLSLPVALRLIESGLPQAQALARGFFEEDGSDWSERVLGLCDSPSRFARRDGLELLARFPSRWTPELLAQLAQHDDPLVQSFVAARLSQAPKNAPVVAFENAILNARGRSRRAKNSVQQQFAQTPQPDAAQLQSLLDAARNGAPRDRSWALAQLVRLKMAGADVGELQLNGAVARATSGKFEG